LELMETARVVQNVMENAYTLSIPITTDANWGVNWGQLTPIENSTRQTGIV
jgi:DNA polymerase-1